MRRIALSFVALALVGCAAHAPEHASRRMPAALQIAQSTNDDAAATALAFDPPLMMGEPPVELSRELREHAAFVGYEDQTVTTFYIRTDDRQYGPNCTRYERRAIMEKSGAVYR